jgi:hypothetical protein
MIDNPQAERTYNLSLRKGLVAWILLLEFLDVDWRSVYQETAKFRFDMAHILSSLGWVGVACQPLEHGRASR